MIRTERSPGRANIKYIRVHPHIRGGGDQGGEGDLIIDHRKRIAACQESTTPSPVMLVSMTIWNIDLVAYGFMRIPGHALIFFMTKFPEYGVKSSVDGDCWSAAKYEWAGNKLNKLEILHIYRKIHDTSS